MNKRNTRDLGFGGAGKGDKDRTTSRVRYAQNYDEIDWHRAGGSTGGQPAAPAKTRCAPNTTANCVAELHPAPQAGGNHQCCDSGRCCRY